MGSNELKSCILSQLKRRNFKEHSFQELIQYSNKLLESLDYLKKETRKIQTESIPLESLRHPEGSKLEDSNLLAKYHGLQEELKQCHIKISEFAQQVLELKNVVDEKNSLLCKLNNELENTRTELKTSNEINEKYLRQLTNMKSVLQDKIDEFDALNITFSSVENKNNDLEIEMKKLKEEILSLKSLGRSSGSSESLRSASITSALMSAANDISVGKSARNEAAEKRESSSPKSKPRQHFTSTLPSKVKHDLIAHDSEVNAVVWLPKMSCFLTGGSDRKVKFWEMCDSGIELRENIRGCNSSILSIDVDPEANLLLCASSDFASRVWTMWDFMIRHTLTGHSGKVTSSKFMSETNRIVSGSSDQTLKLWDLRQRVCIVTYGTNAPVNDVISRPSNFVISGHTDKKIRVWDPRVGNEITHLACSKAVTSLDLSRNGYLLLASERGECLKLFDLRVFKETFSLQEPGFEIACDLTRAKFSPDYKYCCCGSKNGSIYLWNVASGKLEKQLKGHNSSVTSCCWSSCGSYLASCDKNRHCLIWS
ncbi:autophagy-related protein 16-1 [Parasteatoda tepidariorum]|uniref:Autophagy-related protein 16-1 n=1 Tax=Parasteatoda tepidariorum TaxID=114398 RepID=A0A2L2YG83_PARTP|nr:autophagy-related protein 16-1 [Parasteatoda tepidariorum]